MKEIIYQTIELIKKIENNLYKIKGKNKISKNKGNNKNEIKQK